MCSSKQELLHKLARTGLASQRIYTWEGSVNSCLWAGYALEAARRSGKAFSSCLLTETRTLLCFTTQDEDLQANEADCMCRPCNETLQALRRRLSRSCTARNYESAMQVLAVQDQDATVSVQEEEQGSAASAAPQREPCIVSSRYHL